MQIDDITFLFDYNYWANEKILSAAEQLDHAQLVASQPHSYNSLFNTLVHMMDAEMAWLKILQGGIPADELDPAEFDSLHDLRARWQEEKAAMRAYLAELSDGDMASAIRYTSDAGVLRERVLWHCLMHMVNHGTQHRAEVAAVLTELGRSPGDLDLVIFLNESRQG